MEFFDYLENDFKTALKAQLRDLWTHTSTAIEGNTLTLGETKFVIEEGLTVSGKPLKDHHEVVGHARAIDLIYGMLGRDRITQEDLFNLHKAVMTQVVVDVYQPIGEWKREPNGTYFFNEATQQQDFFEFTSPADTPALMESWIAELNCRISAKHGREGALKAYSELHTSFVTIHPFFDGNGRVGRLVSNIPVLKSGHPPILIPKEKRQEYIRALVAYQLEVGVLKAKQPVIHVNESLRSFEKLCAECWQNSIELVDRAHAKQAGKDQAAGIAAAAEGVTDVALKKKIIANLRSIKALERMQDMLKGRGGRKKGDRKEELSEIKTKLSHQTKEFKEFVEQAELPAAQKSKILRFVERSKAAGLFK